MVKAAGVAEAPDTLAIAGRADIRRATVLDWTSHGPAGAGSAGPPRPCALCGRPAICRAPGGRAVHKVCAERDLDRPRDAS